MTLDDFRSSAWHICNKKICLSVCSPACKHFNSPAFALNPVGTCSTNFCDRTRATASFFIPYEVHMAFLPAIVVILL